VCVCVCVCVCARVYAAYAAAICWWRGRNSTAETEAFTAVGEEEV
jgi:hypothetical protein